MNAPTIFACRRAHWLHYAWIVISLVALPMSAFAKDKGEKYALLVGVKQYDEKELKNLPYSEADVTDLAKLLVEQGYRDENVLLMTQAVGAEKSRALPLAANIRKQLKLRLSNLEADDTFLLAFAGHGVQFKGSDESFFCPMDARLTDRATLVSLKEVYADLKGCRAGFKLVLVDACRNEPRTELSRSREEVDLQSVSRPQKIVPPGGVAAFFSCSEGQKAYEYPALGHGVFFNFVIEGLRGGAVGEGEKEVTLLDLQKFVTRRTKDFVIDKLETEQLPQMVSDVHDVPVLARLDIRRIKIGGKEKPGEATLPLPDAAGQSKGSFDQIQINGNHKPGETITNSLGMKLAYIPAGEFLMGSPENETGRGADEKQHRVRITKPFYMGVYTVTQEEYEKVIGRNPSYFAASGGGNDRVKGLDTKRSPVEMVSWYDAQKFCAALGKKEGKTYRLPTEAEWEYACRAGTTTAFAYGNSLSSEQANFDGNYPYGGAAKGPNLVRTTSVGRYKPNAWGLYDMHGNVPQWCQDCFDKDYYSDSPLAESQGPTANLVRVYRGGRYDDGAVKSRSACRSATIPELTVLAFGFRVVRGR